MKKIIIQIIGTQNYIFIWLVSWLKRISFFTQLLQDMLDLFICLFVCVWCVLKLVWP